MLETVLSWTTLWWILLILYVPSCAGLIVIVLLQKGKGTGFAGAFGMGPGSDAVFGPRASKSLPVKMTYVMATLFMVIAMVMSVVGGRMHRGIAPEKVEGAELLGSEESVDGGMSFEGLDELGSGVDAADVPDAETAGDAEAADDAAGVEVETSAGGSVTVTPAAPAPPVEDPGSVSVEVVTPDAEAAGDAEAADDAGDAAAETAGGDAEAHAEDDAAGSDAP